MKTLFLIFTISILFYVSASKGSVPHRMLQFLRVLSADCNFHGFLYKNKCFCEDQYEGAKCETKMDSGIYDTDDKCDDLSSRLDHLLNISPNYYPGDDDIFSRFDGKSIGDGEAAYGSKGDKWIKLHDVVSPFQIFNELEATDIHQGSLGDCYLLAAFVSLATINKGQIIKNVFTSIEDNANHVYVTRWLIDGKPRYVAVDDWVPGTENKPSFAAPSINNDTWPVILEKAWAKIHGTFMAIEAGWHTEVWQAMTQAPGYDKYHTEKDTANSIYTLIRYLLGKSYPVGAATINVDRTNEVSGHAYSIIGAYEVTLDNGTKEKLIRMYNPWNREVWSANPWSDFGDKWTQGVIAQVPFVKANDGIFYVSTKNYLENFGATNWAEVRDGYDISFQDVTLKSILEVKVHYSTKFVFTAAEPKDLYVFIDQSDTRLNLGCDNPVEVINITVLAPNGKTYRLDRNGYNVKIANATAGEYVVFLSIIKKKDYVKYFTITIYGPEGAANFIALANNEIKYNRVPCLNNCSDHGECNNFNGICKCDFEWGNKDCSKKIKIEPVVDLCLNKDCSGSGICIKGICMCNRDYEGDDCETHTVPEKNCSSNGVFSTKTGKCICSQGFNGENCEVKQNFCEKTNCSGNGVCKPKKEQCVCFTGFKGDNCEIKDLCVNKNCSGNGNCSSKTGKCLCSNGYKGVDCQNKAVNENLCKQNNCSGNGICNISTGACKCALGFKGDKCKDVVCNCSNQGKCDKFGTCICKPEFMGKNCESKVNRCQNNNCSKNSLCNPANGKCDCFVGYNGQTCEKKMNCAGNNCSNHGKCNILTGKCACTKGYEGQFCNITRDICLNKNCSGNGVCLSATGKCVCSKNYSGEKCEKALITAHPPPPNNCEGLECGKNGICHKKSGNCICNHGFSGPLCNEIDVHDVSKNVREVFLCDENSCSHNGVCNDETGACLCEDGFIGENCERAA